MFNDKSSLARGLDAILRLNNETKNDFNQKLNIVYLEIGKVKPNKQQPRKIFKDDSLYELANSISNQGILQPIIVRETKDNLFEIIAGERRWRAAKLINLKNIPAIVRVVDDVTADAFSLIENIQRVDLNPIEVAIGIQKLFLEYKLTHEKIAQLLGKSRPTITNTLRLLELDDSLKLFLKERKLDMGHARAMVGLDSQTQLKIAQEVMDNQLTVRQTEKLVNTYKVFSKKVKSLAFVDKNQLTIWKKNLAERVHADVSIKINSEGGGRVVINLNSVEDIKWFIENVTLNEKNS